MIEVVLIRHSMTEGNQKKRYIGKTDEALCAEGIALLKGKHYPEVSRVIVSPMRRCLETAKIIYPEIEQEICQDMRECDFGDFENKNYLELAQNADYQRWVDSNGTLPFPNGEAVEAFKERTVKAFLCTVNRLLDDHVAHAAMVVHGGSIRSIMERLAVPKRNFYEYEVENGGGYQIRMRKDDWRPWDREAGTGAGCVIRDFQKLFS